MMRNIPTASLLAAFEYNRYRLYNKLVDLGERHMKVPLVAQPSMPWHVNNDASTAIKKTATSTKTMATGQLKVANVGTLPFTEEAANVAG